MYGNCPCSCSVSNVWQTFQRPSWFGKGPVHFHQKRPKCLCPCSGSSGVQISIINCSLSEARQNLIIVRRWIRLRALSPDTLDLSLKFCHLMPKSLTGISYWETQVLIKNFGDKVQTITSGGSQGQKKPTTYWSFVLFNLHNWEKMDILGTEDRGLPVH